MLTTRYHQSGRVIGGGGPELQYEVVERPGKGWTTGYGAGWGERSGEMEHSMEIQPKPSKLRPEVLTFWLCSSQPQRTPSAALGVLPSSPPDLAHPLLPFTLLSGTKLEAPTVLPWAQAETPPMEQGLGTTDQGGEQISGLLAQAAQGTDAGWGFNKVTRRRDSVAGTLYVCG